MIYSEQQPEKPARTSAIDQDVTAFASDSQRLTLPGTLNAPIYRVPILESIKAGGRPVEIGELFYNPHWSQARRIVCNVFTALGLVVCLVALIAILVGFVQALQWVKEKERLKNMGIFMVPNIIDDGGDGIFQYNFNYSSEPTKWAKIDSYVKEIDTFLTKYYAEKSRLNFDHIDFSEALNCTKENNYGYNDNKPCILLGIRNVGYWKPELSNHYLESYDMRNNFPKRMRKNFNRDHAPIACKLDQYNSMTMNIGLSMNDWEDLYAEGLQKKFNYYPEAGLPLNYFSQTSSEENPSIAALILIQLNDLEEMAGRRVECQLMAENLNKFEGVQKISFQLANNVLFPNRQWWE